MKNLIWIVSTAPYKDYSVKYRVYFPTIPLYVATILSNKGYEVRIIDLIIEKWDTKTIEDQVLSFRNYLALVIIDFTTKHIPSAVWFADTVKASMPEVQIGGMGLHAIMYPNQIVNDKSFDFAITGDAEPVIEEIVKKVVNGESLNSVCNIALKNNSVKEKVFTNLDDLPLPNFNLLDIEKYLYRDIGFITGDFSIKRTFRFSASRGCVYKCSFCTDPFKGYQRMSNATIIKHLDYITSICNPEIIFFDDPEFFIEKGNTLALIDTIAKRYNFKCISTSRAQYYNPNYISKEVIEKYSNTWIIWDMGVETSSQNRLSAMSKKIRIDNVYQAADYIQSCDARGGFSFMVGMPDESEEDMLQTVFFMEELKAILKGNVQFTYQYYQPIGTTLMTKMAEEKGYLSPDSLREWESHFDVKTGSISITRFPWLNNINLVHYLMAVVKYAVNEIYKPDEESIARFIKESWKLRKAKNYWKQFNEVEELNSSGYSFFSEIATNEVGNTI